VGRKSGIGEARGGRARGAGEGDGDGAHVGMRAVNGNSLLRLDRRGGGGVQRDFGGGGARVRDEWLWTGLNRCFELFNNFFKKFLKPGGFGRRERRVGQGVLTAARRARGVRVSGGRGAGSGSERCPRRRGGAKGGGIVSHGDAETRRGAGFRFQFSGKRGGASRRGRMVDSGWRRRKKLEGEPTGTSAFRGGRGGGRFFSHGGTGSTESF
jgi:hypothetical protein